MPADPLNFHQSLSRSQLSSSAPLWFNSDGGRGEPIGLTRDGEEREDLAPQLRKMFPFFHPSYSSFLLYSTFMLINLSQRVIRLFCETSDQFDLQ